MVCTICYDWCNDHSEGSGEYWLALGEWEGRSPEIARLQPQKGETTSGVPICDDCGTAYLFDGGGTQKSVIIMGCKFNVSNTLREGV